MKISRDSLALAFPDDTISVAEQGDLPAAITDPDVRTILTDVGFPEEVVSCIMLEELDAPLQTLAEYRKSGHAPDKVADCYVIAITEVMTVCLGGASGQCFFVPRENADDQEIRLAASKLEYFLDFLSTLNVELADLEGSSDEETKRVEDRLIAGFRAVDPDAVAASEGAWRREIQRCIGEVLL